MISPDKVTAILDDYATGVATADIAARHQVGTGTISRYAAAAGLRRHPTEHTSRRPRTDVAAPNQPLTPTWIDDAVCRRVDPDLFYPAGKNSEAIHAATTAAKAICRTCPVAAECLEHAVTVREPYGVWGGLTSLERQRLHRVTSDNESAARQVAL